MTFDYVKLTTIQIKHATRWQDLALSLQLEIYQNMLKTCTAAEIIHITGMTSAEHTDLEDELTVATAFPVNEDELHQRVDEEYYKGLQEYADPPSYSVVMEKHMHHFVRSGQLYHPYEYEVHRAQEYLQERDLDKSLTGIWWPEQQHSLSVEDEEDVQSLQDRMETHTGSAEVRKPTVSSEEPHGATDPSASTSAAKADQVVRPQRRNTSQTRAPLSDSQVRAGTEHHMDVTINKQIDCKPLQMIEGGVRHDENLHTGAEDLSKDQPTAHSHGHPAPDFVTPERNLIRQDFDITKEPPTILNIDAERRVPSDRRRKVSNESMNDKENLGSAVVERLPLPEAVMPPPRKRRAIDRSNTIADAVPSENLPSMSKNDESAPLPNMRAVLPPFTPLVNGQQYSIGDEANGLKSDVAQAAHREASTPPQQVSKPGLSSSHFPPRPKKSKAQAASPPDLMTCSPKSSTSKKNSSFLTTLTNDSFDKCLDLSGHKSRASTVQERLRRAQFELPGLTIAVPSRCASRLSARRSDLDSTTNSSCGPQNPIESKRNCRQFCAAISSTQH